MTDVTTTGAARYGAAPRPGQYEPATVLRFAVYGLPAPQGSKKHVGRGVMVESSKKVKPWRSAVHAAALVALAGLPVADRRLFPVDGPVHARMVFTMPKPLSAPKTRTTWPIRYPDVSKLLRSTEDALTTAGVWADDARVIGYDRVAKVFPGEDPEALDAPGALIVVRRLVDMSLAAAA